MPDGDASRAVLKEIKSTPGCEWYTGRIHSNWLSSIRRERLRATKAANASPGAQATAPATASSGAYGATAAQRAQQAMAVPTTACSGPHGARAMQTIAFQGAQGATSAACAPSGALRATPAQDIESSGPAQGGHAGTHAMIVDGDVIAAMRDVPNPTVSQLKAWAVTGGEEKSVATVYSIWKWIHGSA
ncbi:hypothetical protein NUW54_g10494 [Trametes sanguinea]|uniref:Uncharacterized protein n=1 Tax=Trametes sanguinea TaxID=158606 RepID=A0ACC1NZG7_9APHY|nr:hypothetical protein NUW54_g10494 [Trametes sanguinea]